MASFSANLSFITVSSDLDTEESTETADLFDDGDNGQTSELCVNVEPEDVSLATRQFSPLDGDDILFILDLGSSLCNPIKNFDGDGGLDNAISTFCLSYNTKQDLILI